MSKWGNGYKESKHIGYPDYERGSIYTTAATSYTMPEDGYVVYTRGASDATNYALLIDGVVVTGVDSVSSGTYAMSFSGFVKKGSVLRMPNGATLSLGVLRVFGLV